MSRPKGSASRPGAGRTPGPPERAGHRAALDALGKGAPFKGLALAKEAEVSAEYEVDGVDALLLRDAIRLQTVADLYYDAILCASQQGNLKTLDNYLTRHAGLTARAMQAWTTVREMQRQAKDGSDIIIDAVEAAREATGDDG